MTPNVSERIRLTFKNHKKGLSIVTLLILFVLVFTFLTKDRRRDLPYRVSGQELLEIKEKCKNLAQAKEREFNSYNMAYHSLDGYGYSEYRGTCYAEFIQSWDDWKSIMLYDTIEEKQLNTREWPDDISWYESDFDHIILGKSRIWDFRQPW